MPFATDAAAYTVSLNWALAGVVQAVEPVVDKTDVQDVGALVYVAVTACAGVVSHTAMIICASVTPTPNHTPDDHSIRRRIMVYGVFRRRITMIF